VISEVWDVFQFFYRLLQHCGGHALHFMEHLLDMFIDLRASAII
jgi:hypothetical protein